MLFVHVTTHPTSGTLATAVGLTSQPTGSCTQHELACGLIVRTFVRRACSVSFVQAKPFPYVCKQVATIRYNVLLLSALFLLCSVPAAVPGIHFLSGGMSGVWRGPMVGPVGGREGVQRVGQHQHELSTAACSPATCRTQCRPPWQTVFVVVLLLCTPATS